MGTYCPQQWSRLRISFSLGLRLFVVQDNPSDGHIFVKFAVIIMFHIDVHPSVL